jgi:hypothetical protein
MTRTSGSVVDARVAEAGAAGADLVRPLFAVVEVGRIATLKGPTGAVVGWTTQAKAPETG